MTQLRPIVAGSEDVAVGLTGFASAPIHGRMLRDALDRRHSFARWFNAHGFAIERIHTRIAFKRHYLLGDPGCLLAIAGSGFR